MKKPAAQKAKTKKTGAKKAISGPVVKKKAAAPSSPTKRPAKIAPVRRARAAKRDLASLPSRMILVDVENTSSEERLVSVLEHLKIDRTRQRTDLVAVGNWKAVGSRTGRLLARSGAQLMHSAPATGVRDWSDLWIAVAAGRWIAHARPGDRLDIVSDDHAFDAVADAAAGGGVEFHRISYRVLTGAPEEPIPESPPKRRRRGGRGRTRSPHQVTALAERSAALPPRSAVTAPRQPQSASPGRPPAPRHGDSESDGAHTASPADIREAVRRLTGGDPQRWVNLDLVGNELRAQGFTRPPGSPRLVTRVRQVEDVEVSPTGMARIKPGATPAVAEHEPETVAEAPAAKPARPRRPPRKRAPAAAAASPAAGA